MKDNLFEILMNFFEKSLSQISSNKSLRTNQVANGHVDEHLIDANFAAIETVSMQRAHDTSIRVFTNQEQLKLTKASYQYLSRLLLWGIIASEHMEFIINQLMNSDSCFVTLQETKWTIRNILAKNLDVCQLAFLDLVLYNQEDGLPLH